MKILWHFFFYVSSIIFDNNNVFIRVNIRRSMRRINKKLVISVILVFCLLCYILYDKLSDKENPIEITGASVVKISEDPELKKEVMNLQNEVVELKSELNKYDGENVEKIINLTNWKISDVINGLELVSEDVKNSTSYTYVYNSDDHVYFSYDGPLFGYDPFWKLVYSQLNTELSFSHLRIFKLNEDYTKANEVYQDYESKIMREEVLDPDMNCEKTIDCRDVQLVICNKQGKTFYSWYKETFLFSAYDNGEALNIFREFYC